MTNDLPLTPEEILEINTHGPFNHSVWRGRGVVVSHEEGLSGRVEFLSRSIATALRQRFSEQDMSALSILDIGCYDGWMLHSLRELGFGRYVGVDPRLTNIERGRVVRRLLNISENAEFHQGSLEQLPDVVNDTRFDVVLCLGVLHHLSSVAAGLKALTSLKANVLFIESAVLPSDLKTPEIQEALELKDIVYRESHDGDELFGISGQKWETAYYPGSAITDSVVEIPTLPSLTMHLRSLGYGGHKVLADWKGYARHLPKLSRPVQAVCLEVECSESWFQDIDSLTLSVEFDLLRCVLPSEIMNKLADASDEQLDEFLLRLPLLEMDDVSAGERELLLGLRHNTMEKVQFEQAKLLLADGNTTEGIERLELLVTTVNVDWRVCYRSFFLLWHANCMEGRAEQADQYKQRCLNCHPEFPTALFSEELAWVHMGDNVFDKALSHSF